MTKKSAPVANIVSKLLEDARRSHADGPSSPLYGARAQLSGSLNQAGTWLAKLKKDEVPARSTLFQSILGLSPKGSQPKKRSWFFARVEPTTALSVRRIETLLKVSAKGAERLSFEKAMAAHISSDMDIHCELPEGASDPVCAPRKS